MKITFQTQNQILDFLITRSKIVYNRYPEAVIHFSNQKYSVSEFLKYLTDLDIILPKFTWSQEYDHESRVKRERLIESGFEFHYRNFELLFDNELIQKNIYPFRLLTIKETTEILGVTRPTVYSLINENKINTYQILSQQKVKFLDLLRFIEANKNIKPKKNELNQSDSGFLGEFHSK